MRRDFEEIEQLSQRLRELKQARRAELKSPSPDAERLGELSREIENLLRRRRASIETAQREIREAMGRGERGSLAVSLPPIEAAFCSNSGRTIDTSYGRVRRIVVFAVEKGVLCARREIINPGRLVSGRLAGVAAVFARRFTPEESAALEANDILPVRTREKDFRTALDAHAEQVRFFIEG